MLEVWNEERNCGDHPGLIVRYWHTNCLVLVSHILTANNTVPIFS